MTDGSIVEGGEAPCYAHLLDESSEPGATAMSDADSNPIDRCLDAWHRHLRGRLEGGLDAILREDVVFLSPIVFTPIEGREMTKLYLGAAGNTLGGDDEPSSGEDSGGATTGGGFRYVRTITGTHDALLEFETTMDGIVVNGIDLITCDDDGLITEFKVMIRPLKAINAVHAQMKAMLETMQAERASS